MGALYAGECLKHGVGIREGSDLSVILDDFGSCLCIRSREAPCFHNTGSVLQLQDVLKNKYCRCISGGVFFQRRQLGAFVSSTS